MLDAEAHPPDVQLREPVDAAGGEGDAVVGPNGVRQPALPEGVLEHRPDPTALDVGQAPAGQQVAGVLVADGAGIAPDAVPGGELAFEVSGPQIVRSRRGRRHHSGMLMRPASPSLRDQAFATWSVAVRPRIASRASDRGTDIPSFNWAGPLRRQRLVRSRPSPNGRCRGPFAAYSS
jgi:hypothetical protein